MPNRENLIKGNTLFNYSELIELCFKILNWFGFDKKWDVWKVVKLIMLSIAVVIGIFNNTIPLRIIEFFWYRYHIIIKEINIVSGPFPYYRKILNTNFSY
jgi:hypothetical protein